MRRAFTALLVALLASAVAGCGNDPNAGGAGSSTGTSTKTPAGRKMDKMPEIPPRPPLP